jgi:hypothetical protein
MANRAALGANLTIRYVIDSAADATPVDYTASRTFEVMNATTVFNTAINTQTFTLSKSASAIGVMTSTAVNDVNVQIANIDDANANFVSGNILRLQSTAANLRGRTYVQILPSVTAST